MDDLNALPLVKKDVITVDFGVQVVYVHVGGLLASAVAGNLENSI
jgi:hypothetical protein